MVALSPSDIERLWRGIDRRGPGDCWPWKLCTSVKGYGRFRVQGKLYLPHRLIYEICIGSIPESAAYHGSVVMHSCDNPRCCNPDHLSVGEQIDNVKDMDRKGRRRSAPPSGERSQFAQLTAAQVLAIRSDPRSAAATGTAYGVSKSCVTKIRTFVNWKHITPA